MLLGSSLTRCAVNGQQCCHQLILDFVNHALSSAVNNETIIDRFTANIFATAQNAIDEMRNKTNGMKYHYNYILSTQIAKVTCV